MKLLLAILAALLVAAAPVRAAHEGVTLSDLLNRTSKYTILIDLLTYTDLLTTVMEAQNITIFAPTDFGFMMTAKALDCEDTSSEMAIAMCFKDMGKATVSDVLKYHVVPGLFPSEDVLARNRFDTLLGQTFTRRGLRLNDMNEDLSNPKLITTMLDMRYQYGYVHAINGVLMPSMDDEEMGMTLSDVLMEAGNYGSLIHFLEYSDLLMAVSDMMNVTIFAPTDRAFMKSAMELGCEDVSSQSAVHKCYHDLFTDEQLVMLLKYHLTMGTLKSDMVSMMSSIKMSNDVYVYRHKMMLVDQVPHITNAGPVESELDMMYDNGIVHGISRVLLPFRDIMPPKPCDTFEFPISLADTSFLPIFKIILGAQKCEKVRMAMMECDVLIRDICSGNRGDKFIGFGLDIGEVVATAKKCEDVVMALRSCKAAM